MVPWFYSLTPFPFFYLAFLMIRRILKYEKVWELLGVSLPLGLSLMLVTVDIPGRILHDFNPALLLGSVFCFLSGVLVQKFWEKPACPVSFRVSPRLSDLPLLIVALSATTLITLVIFRYAIYDEVRMQGHLPVVESILLGKFPPSYIAFPDIPYRYHYGFNLVAAVFSRAFHLPGYLGVDVASLLSWYAILFSLILFLRKVGLPRPALGLALAFCTLSGGLSWWISRNDPGMGVVYQLPNWQQMFVMLRGIHPHFVMYFFQHPMGLGLGIFLATLLAFHEWFISQRKILLFLGIFLLGSLSLAQVMLFATLLAALGLVFFFRFFQKGVPPLENLWQGVAVALLAGAMALALGGFFQFSANMENQPLLLSWPPSYLRYEFWGASHPLAWWQDLIWYFSGFGIFLFFIPYGFYWGLRQSAWSFRLLAFFCLLCFLVPLFFRYPYSWDIIKWYFGFEFSGRILIACAYFPWATQKLWRTVLAWAIVLFGMVTPINFLKDLALKPHAEFTRAELRIAGYTQPHLQDALRPLVERMQRCAKCYGMVWSSPNLSEGLALYTGYPMVQIYRNTVAMPVGRERIKRRIDALAALESAPTWDLLRTLQIKWIIFPCQDWDNFPQGKKNFLQSMAGSPKIDDQSYSAGTPECYRALYIKAY